MKEVVLGKSGKKVPSVIVGCMRLGEKDPASMNRFIHTAMEQGAWYFDHADIYAGGASEEIFGKAWSKDPSLHREDRLYPGVCGRDSQTSADRLSGYAAASPAGRSGGS